MLTVSCNSDQKYFTTYFLLQVCFPGSFMPSRKLLWAEVWAPCGWLTPAKSSNKIKRRQNFLAKTEVVWQTASFPPVSWISYKTISMTCRRSTVGRVRTVRQGLRITAGSEPDEHTIRGRATRAYLPFHDDCHHLRVRSASPPPTSEGFLTKNKKKRGKKRGKFLFFIASGESSGGNLPRQKDAWKSWRRWRGRNEKSGDVNLGERNRIQPTEGEAWSCRAPRARWNKSWTGGGLARLHSGFELKLASSYKLLLSYTLICYWYSPTQRCSSGASPPLSSFMHTYSTWCNVNLPWLSKKHSFVPRVPFWCELLMDRRHARHMSHTLHTKPPFGIVFVGDPWHERAPFQRTSLNISHTRLWPVFIAYPLWGAGIRQRLRVWGSIVAGGGFSHASPAMWGD